MDKLNNCASLISDVMDGDKKVGQEVIEDMLGCLDNLNNLSCDDIKKLVQAAAQIKELDVSKVLPYIEGPFKKFNEDKEMVKKYFGLLAGYVDKINCFVNEVNTQYKSNILPIDKEDIKKQISDIIGCGYCKCETNKNRVVLKRNVAIGVVIVLVAVLLVVYFMRK